jgi:hypothetical protein
VHRGHDVVRVGAVAGLGDVLRRDDLGVLGVVRLLLGLDDLAEVAPRADIVRIGARRLLGLLRGADLGVRFVELLVPVLPRALQGGRRMSLSCSSSGSSPSPSSAGWASTVTGLFSTRGWTGAVAVIRS